MKRRLWLLAGLLTLGAFLLWIILGREQHPDTSAVVSYAPYMELRGDIAPSWSPDDKQVIYSRGGPEGQNLYLIPADGGIPRPFLAGDGSLPVWSHDGTRVVFSSERRGKFQLMRALGLARPINIWTASASGGDLRQVTDSSVSFVDASWSPDGMQIAFTAFPGPRVMTVPASGGEAKLLAYGFSPSWSPDGKRVAYFSSQPGQGGAPYSILIQSAGGGAVKSLGSFVIRADIFFRPTLDWSPDGERLLTIQLENGQWQPIVINQTEDRIESTLPTAGSAIYPRWSHDGKRIAYGLTDTGHPLSIEVLTLESGQRAQLTPRSTYTTAQLVRYKSTGDLDIPSWLYLPRDSDVARHPALIWLHGGWPGRGSTTNEFDRSIQYFVDQGFVVLAPNYRGSAGFGVELARFGRGDDIVPDMAAAVNYLNGLKSVDAAHIGVVGFSFGGFLALRSITQRPELFAAAVDFYGLSDLVRYYQDNPPMRPALSELLGGTPGQNPEAYRAASPINFVDRIKTPVLIVHGTADAAAPYKHSVELAKALERAHKDYEFISYRFAGHGFSGKDEIDANQQAMRFLLAHLQASRFVSKRR
jgi:dipeptidyl aminopeptidase/acylaminoacyl peptidase